MTSSPLRLGASLEEELDYYKKQYEQLETEIQDFQATSKEIEEQLERDIETAEKSERKLKEQVEKLKFEVEEWKGKHKQAKAEANSAQNALQKEVTQLREECREMKARLRDVEVVNDDYERQARNTEMSLEDVENKYNVAIERGVMLEEEVKVGEQEREGLRIETQRVRDELGDLKVESEITLEKLRLADETIERLRSRKPSPLAVENLRARSPATGSEASGITSPTASTPPPKSDTMSDAVTPPSPPLSDTTPVQAKQEPKTPMPEGRRSLIPPPDAAATPRPHAGLYGPRAQLSKHSRGPSMASSGTTSTSDAKAMRPPASKPVKRTSTATASEGLPRSDSLYQIKALRGRMQKIEERVHSARSKLPAPGTRTPTGSPRNPSSSLGVEVPSSVTMRRSMKRPSGSVASSLANESTNVDGAADGESKGRRESQIGGSKRLSYGIPRPTSSAGHYNDRPPSAMDRPPSAHGANRPSSRASLASASGRPSSRAGARTPIKTTFSGRESTFSGRESIGPGGGPARPSSRAGARTPITSTFSGRESIGPSGPARPRSSIGGNYATIHSTTPRSHRPSASVSELRRKATESEDSTFSSSKFMPSTPSRRTTMEKGTGLPTPGGFKGRQSGGGTTALNGKTLRRTSTQLGGEGGGGGGEMRPPPSRRKMSDLGETY